MRYVLFVLWASVSVYLLVTAVSDFLFGRHDARRLAQRVALSLLWPLAILSEAGRTVLLTKGRSP